MTTYRILAPHFVAAVIVSGDVVMQSAPILRWAVGRYWQEVRDYCQKKGWKVEPLIDLTVKEAKRPSLVQLNGSKYELHWNGPVLTRVTQHKNGEEIDLQFSEMPEQIQRLL